MLIKLNKSLRFNHVNQSTNNGVMTVGIVIISSLILALLAGTVATQYLRTKVIISPATTVQKNFTFTTPNKTTLIGEHTIDFTVTDGTNTFTSDPVTIIVTTPNQPPIVSAGDDLTIRMPLETTLNGIATDDGLPNIPGQIITQWSKTSGPGNVSFEETTALKTTVSFSAAGTYTLRLTANDGKASTYDELTITVTPVPPTPDLSLQADKSLLAINDIVIINVNIADAAPFANWAQYLEFDNTKLELLDQQTGDFSTFITDTRGLSTINNSEQIRAGGFSLTDSNQGTGSLGIFTFKAIGEGQTTITTTNKSNTNLFGNAISETDSYEILPNIISGQVSINVLPKNTAPQVSAGTDQGIQLPIDNVTLNGNVTDDGLPETPGTTTVKWSKVSGVGDVSFSAINEINSSATFSVAGIYTLQLTASDGELSATDDVVITVTQANQAPVASADTYSATQGELLTINAPGVLANDTDPENDALTAILITDVDIANGFLLLNEDGSFTYTSTATFKGQDSFTYKATDDYGSSTETTVIITVNAPNTAPQVNAGADQLIDFPNSTTLAGNIVDDGEPQGELLTLLWTKTSGPGVVTFNNDNLPITTVDFSASGLYTLRLTADDGELTAYDETRIIVNSVPISVNDSYEALRGQSLSVRAPGVLANDTDADGDTLNAELVDNTQLGILSLNNNGSFTYIYDPSDDTCLFVNDQISTPISCNNPDCNEGPCKKSAPWHDSFTYVATDGKGQSRLTTVDITINVVNTAPIVNAGDDQTVAISTGASLNGAVTDDALPDPPNTITTQWITVSGPGIVTFANATQIETTAQFTQSGNYTLRLNANDGEFLTADEVSIEVNSPPLVQAGGDTTVLLNEEAELVGLVSDDGIPSNPRTLAVQWRQISGPAETVINDVLSATTLALFSIPGEYILRLTADDGHLTTFDEVTITVVAKYAEIIIPGQTRYSVRPGETIEIPFEVNTNIIDIGRLIFTMTKNIYFSVIE